VSEKMKEAARSSKVANARLRDLVARGLLEISGDGATVALTPLGLEFARAHAEKETEGKGIKA
jgi:predicted transcriptional regulator